jgi:DNA-binding CsgD family transcriptional regulator
MQSPWPGDWELFRAGDPGLLHGVDGSIESAPDTVPSLATLSRREREVAALLAQGRPNRQIATELAISLGTAERHVTNILTKLGLRSREPFPLAAIARGCSRTDPIPRGARDPIHTAFTHPRTCSPGCCAGSQTIG